MKKLSHTDAIIKCVKEICDGGTKIVSFHAYGSKYNATIGSWRAYERLYADLPYYESIENRAISREVGPWLYFIDNNCNHQVCFISIDNISDFSALRPHHYWDTSTSPWARIKRFLSKHLLGV